MKGWAVALALSIGLASPAADWAPPQSVSVRVQLAPSDRLALQVSRARMRNAHRHLTLLPPELECPPAPTGALAPADTPAGAGLAPADGSCHLVLQSDLWLDFDRTTASLSYHHPRGEGRGWSVTAAWGRNEEQAHIDTDGFLVEGTADLYGGVAFGRAERVEKSDHDLGIRPSLDQFLSGRQQAFDLTKVVLGYARDVADGGGIAASVGAALSISRVPPDLEDRYGERGPLGATVFVGVRPAAAGPR